jgi:molybdopterin molybdotransferase
VLARLGCVTLFHGVAMQPGKPLLDARRGPTLVFGLPGNPGSVMVAFRLFVVPALERLRGGGGGLWTDARAWRLGAPLPAGRARDRFVPARRDGADGALPLAVRGSHDQVTFARAELLLRVRPDDGARAAGATVEGIDFD